ncbi:hypothetical protein JYU34_010012 [Plutella xylostella]|uniref:Carboxylic ester hydrolase n=1 Tax=Plutella xylostella TaxID=51655 RepID=A0ABQ7QIB7_PLUXY|nr:hypothetical protein JYU34_010012 [Plutella xylostella]
MLLELVLFSTLSLCVSASDVLYQDVETEEGLVRGSNVDRQDVFSYYGIPYASAPTGADRFKAPLPPTKRHELFNANIRNIICPQRPIFSDTFLQLNRTIDCLRLNIFTPTTIEKKLPVMVYIHGGGWQEGYGMIFNPSSLAQRGIIAVNINYRLGVHGFLCLGTEFAPGNAGYKDQAAALRWIRSNIAKFGGDPEKVTLAGSSSGSFSVELHMLSDMSRGLFSQVILESVSAISDSGFSAPLDTAEAFLNQFGITTGKNVTQLEYLYSSLSDAALNQGLRGANGLLGFMTCLETYGSKSERFLDRKPADIIREGDYEKRPYLTGVTAFEGIEIYSKPSIELHELVPSNINFSSEESRRDAAKAIYDFYFPTGEVTDEGIVDYYTDRIFVYPSFTSAKAHAKNSLPVYVYLFTYNGTVNLPPKSQVSVKGPGHVAHSLYIQDYDYQELYKNMTADDYVMQNRLREMWANFVKFGEPIPSTTDLLPVSWPPLTPGADGNQYLTIDLQMKYGEDPLKRRYQFWSRLYGSQ